MEFLKKGIIILIGCTFIAIGINGFLVPFGLLEGGALGISLIFHYVMNVKVGLTFLLISIPIFILAWFFYRSFFYNGLHGMLLSSIIIDVFADILGGRLVTYPLMSAAYGGIMIGIGAGIMLRSDISIGGTDLLAQMLARKLNVNSGIVIFCFDIVIVTVGSFIIHSAHLLLSFITVFSIGVTTSLIVLTRKQKQGRYSRNSKYSKLDVS
ncbi:YitT family protein [Sporosarcina pasteurii]|nr:YitT family protein [Sporosarcina pasteurii]MDS9471819.1 YitT family protein [Sporosarcina pasteurii]QBQ04590.1 hypothetical protein E2C16_02350 [Sporosarcina pasteurii]